MAKIKITRDNKFHCGQFVEDNTSKVRMKSPAEVDCYGVHEIDDANTNVQFKRTGEIVTYELIEED